MLHVEDLTIKTGGFQVRSATFHVAKGDYYFLLGESGSGKSLILEAIAGIRRANDGIIKVNGRDITHQPINKRNVGIVFQNLALFPHKNVFQNIAYSLIRKKLDARQIKYDVEEIAQRLSIQHLLKRYPGSLSGGEHQRVALARTLILKPAVLLLDEPFSSLDILLKEEMIELMKEIHQPGQSILHVTHDYQVVASLADRISIIEGGFITQTGTREEIAANPRSRLAERLGDP